MTPKESQIIELRQQVSLKIHDGIFPEIIYKFRIWDDPPNDDILKKRTIKLASPKELLADYDEAHLPIDESLITEENLQKYALFHAQQLKPNKHISYQKVLAKQLRRTMKITDPSHRLKARMFARQRSNEVLGVFCSSIAFNRIYMWENFANLGTGFVVGLDTLEIICHRDITGSAGLVKYYQDGNPPKVSPFTFGEWDGIQKSMKEILNIPARYSQEQELRITRTNRVMKNGLVAKYREEDRIVQLEGTCFKEILLGWSVSQNDMKEIISVRDENLKHVPVYTTKIVNSKVVRSKKY